MLWRVDASPGARVVNVISSCEVPVETLVSAVQKGGCLVSGPARALRIAVAANVAAVHRSIGRRPRVPFRPLSIPPETKEDSRAILGALADIDTALGKLADVFCHPTTNQPLDSGPQGEG